MERSPTFGQQPRYAFGYLRLLFASLVIVSHTPEIIDGNRGRELLTRLFGTLSFGELAVDAFFIVSGFLLTASYLKSPIVRTYLLHRVARIYPAYILMMLICVLLIAPLAGGLWEGWPHMIMKVIKRSAILASPDVQGVFTGTHYPELNGATWTIAHEFRCYLLVLIVGTLNVFQRPWLILASAAVFISTSVLMTDQMADLFYRLPYRPGLWLGNPRDATRLIGMFAAGSAFFLFRDRIAYAKRWAAVAAAALALGLCFDWSASAAVAVFGSYLIFWAAVAAEGTVIGPVNVENDVSYGLYLWAWPATKLLLIWWPAMPILEVGVLTWLIAYTCGSVSWLLVERPITRWVKRRKIAATPPLPTAEATSAAA